MKEAAQHTPTNIFQEPHVLGVPETRTDLAAHEVVVSAAWHRQAAAAHASLTERVAELEGVRDVLTEALSLRLEQTEAQAERLAVGLKGEERQ